MKIVTFEKSMLNQVSPLVAGFRVALQGYKNIKAVPDIKAGKPS